MPLSAKRAVICVFDGLRPDRISEALTPNLWRFVHDGVWFRESRSVVPSMTRVATTSFATGSRPETHGIVNNAFFDLSVVPDRALDTSNGAHIAAAETRYAARFVEAEGLGCALARAGRSYAVAHCGSAGSTYLVNHRARLHGHWTYSIHGREVTPTPEAVDAMVARFGPAPVEETPKHAQIDHVARVFVEHVLPDRDPDVALIWFPEPDTAYHYRNIGSAEAEAITTRVDARFGDILAAVAAGPQADETLVVAMSDHGQITMTGEVDLLARLGEAGIAAAARPGDGVEVLATAGIACGLSLRAPDLDRLDALAALLMEMPETGLLFSRGRDRGTEPLVPGTFAHGHIGLDHPRAPDLLWIARSGSTADAGGLPGTGLFTSGTGVPVGGGMHGGLNPLEQNTLLALGGAGIPALGAIPDPADLTDIVPTLLAALGCDRPASMTGRPLAAVLNADRPGLLTEEIVSRRGAFEQRLTLAVNGARRIPLSGGR
ncbi:MAG: alkaline phosphatase family protein [Pikeienuella sp.]